MTTDMIEKAKSVIDAAKDKMQNAVTYLDEDLKTYRAGKANPARPTRRSSTVSWSTITGP